MLLGPLGLRSHRAPATFNASLTVSYGNDIALEGRPGWPLVEGELGASCFGRTVFCCVLTTCITIALKRDKLHRPCNTCDYCIFLFHIIRFYRMIYKRSVKTEYLITNIQSYMMIMVRIRLLKNEKKNCP